jgi:NAD+ synthase (glutamine-hydrolysing)
MKIALAQINPIIGDLSGNKEKILSFLDQARIQDAELVMFPELALTGWPPKGLLLRNEFIQAAEETLEDILPHTSGIGVLLGTISSDPDTGKLYNSAILMDDGKITGRVHKAQLENRYIFDETNYFTPVRAEVSTRGNHLSFRGLQLMVTIGEKHNEGDELNNHSNDRYTCDSSTDHKPTNDSSNGNPRILVNLSAIPYQYQGLGNRQKLLSNTAAKYQIPLLAVRQVGANDELVFDGSSMVFDEAGNLICQGKAFEEQLLYFDTQAPYPTIEYPLEDISCAYQALILGLRDYFRKNGFQKVLLGLSGGVDSALVACLAVEALGSDNVLGVSMPSRYSPDHSHDDAKLLAGNLGIEYRVLPIEELFATYIKLMNGKEEAVGDLAEENIQARIRGNLLMFISNREGRILLNTSNKSESAMGYSTLYGDMCGSLSPIADIPKTMVYQLCDYINRDAEVIPVNTLTKPPSAELRPNQKDQDSLPDYPVLDAIVQMYLEEKLSVREMVQRGYEKELVLRIVSSIDRTEYKRRQAPPMLKVTSSNLLRGGSLPMVQRFERNAKE